MVLSSEFKKNVSDVNRILANKIFETSISQKIIADSTFGQHIIANSNLICDYCDNYSGYQTSSEESLSFYKKGVLLLPVDNDFLKLKNV